MSWYRGDHGYRIYPSGLPDYQLDPPPEADDDRCNACGELVCEACDGCTQPLCEGKLCPCPGTPDERLAEALDGAIDDAKIRERS